MGILLLKIFLKAQGTILEPSDMIQPKRCPSSGSSERSTERSESTSLNKKKILQFVRQLEHKQNLGLIFTPQLVKLLSVTFLMSGWFKSIENLRPITTERTDY